MPFIASFLAFEKRLKTMNKGLALPTEMVEFLEEHLSRGVATMSQHDMAEITEQLAASLQFDKPVTEQVSYRMHTSNLVFFDSYK
jgi:hypothetical protein